MHNLLRAHSIATVISKDFNHGFLISLIVMISLPTEQMNRANGAAQLLIFDRGDYRHGEILSQKSSQLTSYNWTQSLLMDKGTRFLNSLWLNEHFTQGPLKA